ncbi:hypothetical protein SLEP1_g3134 [Rubroshorea leprosula]|uniref:Uncharacterized protein n=1 Tax=Rubroshorea leprosula TaxID=152421 RepID=A0AAV5HQF4_9ROSI|nr:hypothetical protein SLEP1_g3134 [Rubroshorea leprosula]
MKLVQTVQVACAWKWKRNEEVGRSVELGDDGQRWGTRMGDEPGSVTRRRLAGVGARLAVGGRAGSRNRDDAKDTKSLSEPSDLENWSYGRSD